MSAGRVIVGRLAGVYGIKGWLRVQSFTQPIENVLDYSP
ncbi:MAG: ribosome maturation factor RimM, partial [Pseudomonadota bacterium]